MDTKTANKTKYDLKELNSELINLSALEILEWGFDKFGNNLAFTTSFGIQSSVLLQTSLHKNLIKPFWYLI